MRITIFYVVMIVVTLPAAGQEYDLEPENWFPLEVGNNWHYTNEGGEGVGPWINEWVVESIRDTVVEGQRWTLLSAVHCVKQTGPSCPSGELGWYRFSADDYLLARDSFGAAAADTVLKTQPSSVFSVNVPRDSLYSEFMGDSVAVRITTEDSRPDSTHFQLHVDGNIFFEGRYVYNVGNATRLIGAIVNGVEYGETDAIEYYRGLVEDTLDWRAYHPLQIGNVWERELRCECPNNFFVEYERQHIVGDTTIDGRRYFTEVAKLYDDSLNVIRTSTTHIRYDSTRPAIVQYAPEDTSQKERVWPDFMACDLSADFNSRIICGSTEHAVEVLVLSNYAPGSGPGGLPIKARKFFAVAGAGFGVEFTNGTGGWERLGDFPYGYSNRLIYARLDGQEYGESVVATPLESPAEQPNKFAVVSTYPNPFRGAVTIKYALPSASRVRIFVYDIMGRRVRTEVVGSQPAGTHEFTLRNDGLAAGAYIVRFSDGEGRMATTHVVLAE